ncbi:MAG: RNA polymerase sigma factor [Lachnospiraceae bacterium]|nr:RNA polymerase sigma factor [Lachnospiraceae bacterium]
MDFEKLYNMYYMEVYSYVLTRIKNSHMAEEITQKTFYKAMISGNSFHGQSGEFTWLCAIAKNLVYDTMRHYGHFGETDMEVPDKMNIEHVVEEEDSALRIHQILHTLEEPYKEVFQLRVFGELSFKKIGTIFEKTENWARVTYHRARLKILERMDEE